MDTTNAVVGVLLAGGQSRRMGGGDKGLRMLAGRPLIARVADRARPQVSALLLSANGDPARFSDMELPVRSDVIEGFAGPLAGLLTGLEWASTEHPSATWLATFATDAPFFPEDMVQQLLAQAVAERAEAACARSCGRAHPVFAIWRTDLAERLHRAMEDEGLRKAHEWLARCRTAFAEFPCEPVDPFFNVNRPEDLIEAEEILICSG